MKRKFLIKLNPLLATTSTFGYTYDMYIQALRTLGESQYLEISPTNVGGLLQSLIGTQVLLAVTWDIEVLIVGVRDDLHPLKALIDSSASIFQQSKKGKELLDKQILLYGKESEKVVDEFIDEQKSTIPFFIVGNNPTQKAIEAIDMAGRNNAQESFTFFEDNKNVEVETEVVTEEGV